MTIKHSRLTAISVAFAVCFAYSMPAYGVARANHRGNAPLGAVQTDDDDDEIHGGALAVLLLAIGGAVAGVLYASHPSGTGNKITIDRVSNEITLKMSNDAAGKTSRSTWSAKLDEKSGNITLIQKAIDRAGKPLQSQWTGKLDGKYYPVKGDPIADAAAYTKIDANTLEFSLKKGDHTIVTGRLIVSANGRSRSFTLSSQRTDTTGRRITKQTTYSSH